VSEDMSFCYGGTQLENVFSSQESFKFFWVNTLRRNFESRRHRGNRYYPGSEFYKIAGTLDKKATVDCARRFWEELKTLIPDFRDLVTKFLGEREGRIDKLGVTKPWT
jgi:hypothetical protein